jgi:hypothetical protein
MSQVMGVFTLYGIKRQMKPAKDKKGYLRTMLTDKYGDSKTVKVHRLIAEAFIFNPENETTSYTI